MRLPNYKLFYLHFRTFLGDDTTKVRFTRVVPSVYANRGSLDAGSRPFDSRTYNGPKVRFSATVGQEPEVEVTLTTLT
jgi:hypothetical protein